MYPLTSIVNVVPPCVVLHGRKVEGAKPTVSQMIDVYSRGTDISPGLAVCQLRRFTLNDPTLYITQHSLMEARTDMQFKLKNSIRLTMLFNVPSGPDYSQQGPVQKKMWRPFSWGGRPYFPLKKTGDPCLVINVRVVCQLSVFSSKTGDLFCSSLSFHSGVAHFSGKQKFAAPFVGAPFCGGRCSAEHAEHA